MDHNLFLTFGEIMMRLEPAEALRFRQAVPGRLDASFAGSEANTAASLAMFGNSVRFLTAVPNHDISQAMLIQLKGLGIDTSHVLLKDDGRLGVFFLEPGKNQRSSNVIYDRVGSCIALSAPDEYDFGKALLEVDWVHISGITPALSEHAYRSTLALVQCAKREGAKVSCDLNFRKKLWNWKTNVSPDILANDCMSQVLRYVDVLIGNEEDPANIFGIFAEQTSVETGRINPSSYEQVARKIISRFPGIQQVGITLRESISASHNNWGGMLFDREADHGFFAPLDECKNYRPYEIRHIVDRVGSGDAFAAGLIHGLTSGEFRSPDMAIRFAVAASCLKHSVQGDFNYVTIDEVTSLVGGQMSGRIRR